MRMKTELKNAYKKYSPILNGCGFSEYESNSTIRTLVRSLKREDRIVWALRIKKVEALTAVLNAGGSLTRKQQAFMNKHPQYHEEKLTPLAIASLTHFTSQDIPSFQKIVFERQGIQELIDLFEAKESEYFKKKGDENRDVQEQGEVICAINENLCWFDLGEPYSRLEALSMHHCGNVQFSTGDTIYSLRERISANGKVLWRPHLTFIYNKERNHLGERKGRFNLKPDVKWHRAITKLLSEKIEIRCLLSSTYHYASENDFVISDLSDELQNTLKHNRPDLMNWTADPERKDYEQAAQAWINLTERKNNTLLSNTIIQSLFQNEEEIDYIPFSSKETSCSLQLARAIKNNSQALSACKPHDRLMNENMFFSRLFIEAFFENSKVEAAEAFTQIYTESLGSLSHSNDLYLLHKHYPEKGVLAAIAA